MIGQHVSFGGGQPHLIIQIDQLLPNSVANEIHDPCFLHVDSNFTIYMCTCFYFCRCCNTCEDVREAYRKKGWAFNSPEGIEQCNREGWTAKMKAQQKEGCQVYGYLEVNKVQGNFHFAPGKSFQQHHVHGRSLSF